MINKTVVLDGDCQLIIPEDGELGVISAIRKPYPPYTGDTIVTPSDSIQVLNTELTTLTDNIIVNPVPGDYVGGDIPRRDGDDLTASGATVTAPAGYYEASASKTVPSGTEGTPTATKGAVSNHSVSVTPSVTNAAGYISGGTKTGEPVTVTASELESGTKSITANGEGIDVTGYAAVDVDVPSSEPTLQTITKTYTPSTSQQTETVTASAGYDGIEEVDITVNAMPTGAEGTPTATKGTVSNHSVTVTPSVTNTTGYIEGGTKTGTPVTVSASELDSGTKSITANGNGQDVVGYAAVDVDVPNSYAASDEGKVVSNGALVAQTARSISANGTYDTTTNNSVSVSVPSQSPVINPLSVTENGTYTAPSGVDGYSPVTVNVSGGDEPVPADGKTRLWISIAEGTPSNRLTFYLTFDTTVNNSATVDWGDGTVETLGSDTVTDYAHTYQRGGNYVITVDVSSGLINFGGGVNTTAICGPVSKRYNLIRITKCIFGDAVQKAKSYAFYLCYSLKEVKMSSRESAIRDYTFNTCANLSTVEIPSGCASIGQRAFYNCAGLMHITVPESVTTIGASAFNGCTGISEFHFKRQIPPSLGDSAVFSSIPSDCIIYVPQGCLNAYQTATNWTSKASQMQEEPQ